MRDSNGRSDATIDSNCRSDATMDSNGKSDAITDNNGRSDSGEGRSHPFAAYWRECIYKGR